jgi:predicted Zn-dependent protease with MMP-like domain
MEEDEGRYITLIDQAHSAIDDEDFELAVDLGRQAIELEPDEAEGYFVAGLAFLELAEFRRAVDYLREATSRAPEDPLLETYHAAVRFILGEEEAAEAALRSAIAQEPELADARYWLSLVVERRKHYEEADELLTECARIDPERFARPYRMSRSDLERDLEEVIKELPEPIAVALKDLPIVIEDLPSRAMIEGELLAPDILGLFIGTSLAESSVFNPATEPNAVYLFKRNLERIAASREDLLEEARVTLIHEIGHYLGLDEEDLAERGLD